MSQEDTDITPLTTPAFDNTDFEIVPAGVYVARCFKMVDVGTQDVPYTPPGGKTVTKQTRQIYLFFELLQDDDGNAVFMEDGERVFTIMKQYTWSMHKKANLRSDLDNWRGEPFTDDEAKGFEITKLLGVFCKLQVIHKKSKDGEKTFANVGGIMYTTPKNIPGFNPLSSFSIEKPDFTMFENFPEWLQNKIRDGKEWEVDSGEKDGRITADGKIEIEDLGDSDKPEAKGVDKSKIKKLAF